MAVERHSSKRLSTVDKGLYALFSRHADESAHDRDRQRYRSAGLNTSFEVFIARLYGLGWLAGVTVSLFAFAGSTLLPASLARSIFGFFGRGLPIVNQLTVPAVGQFSLAVVLSLFTGAVVRWLVIRSGGWYLGRLGTARREQIEQTLPGAVRYMRVLASGNSDTRQLLHRVADQEAYGATAEALQDALNRAALAGSLDEGLSLVARDTPSRDSLAPFLLKLNEHASQGGDSLEGYLQMEGRLLSHKQERAHQRATGYLELIAELFVVVLIFPALTVLILTVAGVLSPGLGEPVATPLGQFTIRKLVFAGSLAFVLVAGIGGAWAVSALRPTNHATPDYERPTHPIGILRTAGHNPASAAVVCLVPAAVVLAVLATLGYGPANIVLLGYAAYSLPVGFVSVRRARIDDAKDREIRDFVHAISGHVSLGRPLPDAVQRVAREVDFGPLQSDVEALAFNLSLTTGTEDGADVRAAALDRFVGRIGTPLASQTVGLVVGALEAGSDTENVFETLETEIGRLYHERKTLRSRMVVYSAVGWTTALLVVGIIVAVNLTVLDSFSQLSGVAGSSAQMTLDPTAVDPARDQFRFYLIAQATVLACGWFAGVASRGKYEALLHSGALVVITYLVFTGLGVA
jgi:archaellum biogenesis protein FlaJ (TadC family)